MPVVLYKADASPPARAVMMLLDILGLKLDQRDLNPVLREQDTPDLKKKNPMRTIPLLDEGDYWLADSHAIMIYLLEKYGNPEHKHLYPTDVRKRGTLHQRLFFDCGILFPRLRSIMAPTYGGKLTEMTKNMIANINDAYSKLEDYLLENKYMADAVITIADLSIISTAPTYGGKLTEMTKNMIANINDAYSKLEDYLLENKYMADAVITIADLSIISTVGTLNGLVPIDKKRFPKLKHWFDNMNETDYCKNINIPGSEVHAAGLKALMESNKYNQQSKL